MPIDAGALYGGDTAAATDGSSSSTAGQYQRFVVPRATDPTTRVASFVVRSVLVDNASGVWWLINGRRVPPWTIGGVLRIDTPTAQLDVAIDTPAGQLSENTGEDLVLIATDADLEPSAGVYTPPAVAVSAQRATATIEVNESGAGVAGVVVPGGGGSRIVLVSAQATVTGGGPEHIAGTFALYWLDPDTGDAQVVYEPYFTTEQPVAPMLVYPPGAVVVPVGTDLEADGRGLALAGSFNARLIVSYYRVLP